MFTFIICFNCDLILAYMSYFIYPQFYYFIKSNKQQFSVGIAKNGKDILTIYLLIYLFNSGQNIYLILIIHTHLSCNKLIKLNYNILVSTLKNINLMNILIRLVNILSKLYFK